MGRGVIDLPVEQISVFVCMTDSYYTWDKYLTVSVTVQIIVRSSAITAVIALSFRILER